jgi:hypothetical protein
MKKATFRVREIRTFEFDIIFDDYLSLANMEKAAEKKWSIAPNYWKAKQEAEPANTLVGIKRDQDGDVVVRRISAPPPPEIKRYMVRGSYCTTSGNMRDFDFNVAADNMENAGRRVERLIKGDRRRRYSGKLDMEVCAAGNY